MTNNDFRPLIDFFHKLDVITTVFVLISVVILFSVYWSEEHSRKR